MLKKAPILLLTPRQQAGSRAKTPRHGDATAAAAAAAEFPTRAHRRVPKFLIHGLPRAPTFPTRVRLPVLEFLTLGPPRVPEFPTRAHHPRAAAEFLPQEAFLTRVRRPRRLRRPRRMRPRRRKLAGAVGEAGAGAGKVRRSVRSTGRCCYVW